VAHGGQQLAFWNAHHDERGFAPMHATQKFGPPASAMGHKQRCPSCGRRVRSSSDCGRARPRVRRGAAHVWGG
jgi:hypothetical protein